jgi:hypothetical protein
VVAFCRADTQLADLKGDWAKGAGDALALLLKRGQVAKNGSGRYTFDNAFPDPKPGLHTVKEDTGVVLPDGKKRESHHVPAKALANAWSVELRSIVDELPKSDSEAEYEDVWKPYATAVLARADAFDEAHDSTDGKTLTAILIHPETHRGTPDAVHTANSKDTSEAIIVEVENHALCMRKKASDLVLANPQEEHWRDFIDACYDLVRQGQLEEGVDPTMAEQELAILKKSFGKDEDLVEKEAQKSAKNLESTMKEAMSSAFVLDRGRLAVALRRSSKDGDNTKHNGVLQKDLQDTHDGSHWSKALVSRISWE